MARLELEGVVVRHAERPIESLYERSPAIFAICVFSIIVLWLAIASWINDPYVSVIGTPIVLIGSLLSPIWFLQSTDISGNRSIIIDERGLQVEGALIPWEDMHVTRDGARETATSFWSVGPQTIIATFEHNDTRFSAFLGTRFRQLRPYISSEKLDTTLTEEENLRLEGILADHTKIEDAHKDHRNYSTESIWTGTPDQPVN